MALIIPPPLLALLTAVFMFAVSSSGLTTTIQSNLTTVLALAVFVTGLVTGLAALLSLHSANTTIDPHRPQKASKLIRHGIYKLTRNPMYLSLTLMLASVMIWSGDVLNIAPLMFFVWYINKFQIIPEEKALQQRFPSQLPAYKASVRRWI
jgi:protein-S-isoprenylcysteine O-methyltransferase Ste14